VRQAWARGAGSVGAATVGAASVAAASSDRCHGEQRLWPRRDVRGRGERRAWAQPAWARRPATGGEGVGIRVASAGEAEPGREHGGPS